MRRPQQARQDAPSIAPACPVLACDGAALNRITEGTCPIIAGRSDGLVCMHLRTNAIPRSRFSRQLQVIGPDKPRGEPTVPLSARYARVSGWYRACLVMFWMSRCVGVDGWMLSGGELLSLWRANSWPAADDMRLSIPLCRGQCRTTALGGRWCQPRPFGDHLSGGNW
jgi:hypothetical protein